MQFLANKGDERSIAALNGPECPEELKYLVDWCYLLFARSGVSADGVAPLSYTTIEAWSRLSGNEVDPHEVEALMLLDAALRNPGEEDK